MNRDERLAPESERRTLNKIGLLSPALSSCAYLGALELVALRRVAPRLAAQRRAANQAVRASRSSAGRACVEGATDQSTPAVDTHIEELLRAAGASAQRRRGRVVAARQPLPLNTYSCEGGEGVDVLCMGGGNCKMHVDGRDRSPN